jgi:hypothetical protein
MIPLKQNIQLTILLVSYSTISVLKCSTTIVPLGVCLLDGEEKRTDSLHTSKRLYS